MMIKVRAVGKEREELMRTTDIFRGRIIDVTDKSYTIELTGDSAKLDAFIESIDRASILETVRSGGSGIVILRYADTYPAATSTTGSPTITVSGGYRIYKFTASGSITF
jgi:hypothetical protein